MNVLYFTLDDFDSLIQYRSINTDLLREFMKHGHKVYVVSPSERRKNSASRVITEGDAVIFKPRIGNIQKTNIIEKGISTVTISSILVNGIREYLSDVRFDLILYCTPPITFLKAVEYVKKRDNAATYLLLKDIFPQNAVDIGMMTTGGVKGLLYKHFRRQEKKLYSISDRIGCMSQANVDYVLKHNPEIDPRTVEVCPNSIEVEDKSVDQALKAAIRKKYGVPQDKTVFVYGGNLGKPQGIPFLVDCLGKLRDEKDAFFLIVGDGTEYAYLENAIGKAQQDNVRLMKRLPKEDYDAMVGACDVGMIFLDHRFTIPNFPSRMLSYMQAKIPILACTDPNTDVGKTILEGDFGWWCESNDPDAAARLIRRILREDRKAKGESGWNYLAEHYSVEKAYKTIVVNV